MAMSRACKTMFLQLSVSHHHSPTGLAVHESGRDCSIMYLRECLRHTLKGMRFDGHLGDAHKVAVDSANEAYGNTMVNSWLDRYVTVLERMGCIVNVNVEHVK